MADLLNLAHMPWWAWLAWWFGTFVALMRADRHRITHAGTASAAISSLFFASVLMAVHELAVAWRLQARWGWALMAVSFLMMLFSASRVAFGLIFFMVGLGLLLSNFGVSWMPPLSSILLVLSALALIWTLARSQPKPEPGPAPLDANATAALHARLDEPDAQDGADKYTRE